MPQHQKNNNWNDHKRTCVEHIPNINFVFYPVKSDALPILQECPKIFIACLLKGSQEQSFFLHTLLFMAFLVTVLKMLTYALVSE